MRPHARRHDPDRPFIAEGFDDLVLARPAARLEAAMLDRLARTRLVTRRVCGHLAVANGAALAALAAHPKAASYAERGLIAAESGVLLEDARHASPEPLPATAAELEMAVASAEAMASGSESRAHTTSRIRPDLTLARRDGVGAHIRITVHAAEEQLADSKRSASAVDRESWLKLGVVNSSSMARSAPDPRLRVPFADRTRIRAGSSSILRVDRLVRRIDAAG